MTFNHDIISVSLSLNIESSIPSVGRSVSRSVCVSVWKVYCSHNTLSGHTHIDRQTDRQMG